MPNQIKLLDALDKYLLYFDRIDGKVLLEIVEALPEEIPDSGLTSSFVSAVVARLPGNDPNTAGRIMRALLERLHYPVNISTTVAFAFTHLTDVRVDEPTREGHLSRTKRTLKLYPDKRKIELLPEFDVNIFVYDGKIIPIDGLAKHSKRGSRPFYVVSLLSSDHGTAGFRHFINKTTFEVLKRKGETHHLDVVLEAPALTAVNTGMVPEDLEWVPHIVWYNVNNGEITRQKEDPRSYLCHRTGKMLKQKDVVALTHLFTPDDWPLLDDVDGDVVATVLLLAELFEDPPPGYPYGQGEIVPNKFLLWDRATGSVSVPPEEAPYDIVTSTPFYDDEVLSFVPVVRTERGPKIVHYLNTKMVETRLPFKVPEEIARVYFYGVERESPEREKTLTQVSALKARKEWLPYDTEWLSPYVGAATRDPATGKLMLDQDTTLLAHRDYPTVFSVEREYYEARGDMNTLLKAVGLDKAVKRAPQLRERPLVSVTYFV